MDAVNEMYLWHGWWPQSDEDSDSRASTAGSAETRWSNDRRLAMETTKSYAEGSFFAFTYPQSCAGGRQRKATSIPKLGVVFIRELDKFSTSK